jgi:hypothetical protein
MKTCILLYGHLQDCEKTYSILNNILSKYDVDIYCSFDNSMEDENALLFSEKENIVDVICHEPSVPLWIQNMQKGRFFEKEKTYTNAFHRHMVFIESREQHIYENYIFIDVSNIKCEVIPDFTFENAKLFTNKSYFACNYSTASTLAMIFHELENLYYKGCYFDEMCLIEKTCEKKKIEIISA